MGNMQLHDVSDGDKCFLKRQYPCIREKREQDNRSGSEYSRLTIKYYLYFNGFSNIYTKILEIFQFLKLVICLRILMKTVLLFLIAHENKCT
jgi:hypothetical protein